MGTLVPHAVLVKNSSMVAEVDEFRTEHNLPPMRFFSVPSPATPPAPTPAPAANQPAQRTPVQRQPPRTRETLELRDCYNLGLADIMKHEYFLSNMRKPALMMILNQLPSGSRFHAGFGKDDLIDAIVPSMSQTVPVPVLKLLNNPAFLDQVTVYGLDMIQSSLHWRSDGNHAAKKNCILQHVPLDITVKDEYGEFAMQVTRADTCERFYAKIQNHRHTNDNRISIDPQLQNKS